VICEANPKAYASVLCNKWTKDDSEVGSSTPRGHCGDINIVFRVMAPIRSGWDDQTLIMFDYCCDRFGISDVNRSWEHTDVAMSVVTTDEESEK
jgi:hypothetical protein